MFESNERVMEIIILTLTNEILSKISEHTNASDLWKKVLNYNEKSLHDRELVEDKSQQELQIEEV